MSKPDTISEVLENFYTWCLCGNDECRLYLNYAESLATIEKLLLEAVGKDLPIGDEIAENRSYTGERIHNKIKAEIRTTLKAVLYGEKE